MIVRLQKYLSECGVASRRASEEIIRAGRVSVNGDAVSQLGVKVDPAKDRVAVDGQAVRPGRRKYVALHKPRGYVCSRHDPTDLRLVMELLPQEWEELYPVGRLDRDSEGLIFITNDGDFCLQLTHPRYGIRKRYVATVAGRVTAGVLDHLRHGVIDQGERLRVARARVLSATASRSVVEVEMNEGRNREVRRLFESQGFPVERLIRIQIGNIPLGDLRPGKYRLLTSAEVEGLLRLARTTRPA